MSDRIAVMNGGRVEQIGTPAEIYNQPKTRFTADFIGDTNLLSGTVVSEGGASHLKLGGGLAVPVTPGLSGALHLAIRPEHIEMNREGRGLKGQIDESNFLGGSVLYRVSLGSGQHILARSTETGQILAKGTEIGLSWAPEKAVALAD